MQGVPKSTPILLNFRLMFMSKFAVSQTESNDHTMVIFVITHTTRCESSVANKFLQRSFPFRRKAKLDFDLCFDLVADCPGRLEFAVAAMYTSISYAFLGCVAIVFILKEMWRRWAGSLKGFRSPPMHFLVGHSLMFPTDPCGKYDNLLGLSERRPSLR